MDKVILYQSERPDVKVTIEAYFDDENLVIDGYDIGDFVEKYWGDSDYEYSTTVFAAEVVKLYELLNIGAGHKEGLLNAIAAIFNDNSCYSNFRTFLDLNGIRYESFSWT
jgi:hypothetical protein